MSIEIETTEENMSSSDWQKFLAEGKRAVFVCTGLRNRGVNVGESIITE